MKSADDLVAVIGAKAALAVADFIGSLMHHQRLYADDFLRDAVERAS